MLQGLVEILSYVTILVGLHVYIIVTDVNLSADVFCHQLQYVLTERTDKHIPLKSKKVVLSWSLIGWTVTFLKLDVDVANLNVLNSQLPFY